MSVSNGQLANAATFNGAFVSKSSDSTISATLTQDKESVLKEIATPSTPASGYGKIYFKNDGKLYQLNDAGIETQVGTGTAGGAGGVNFITNGTAEDNVTTGWATYADAAGTSPVDGTGGTANVTIASSATSPLAGTYSFILTKDAVNRQGQGWSYNFSIDATYKAKVLQISFDYLVNSGTFAAGTSSTDSDITVWIYDVTNAQVIQGSSYKLLSNSTSLTDSFKATFQSASNSTSYRLIFHVGSASASAYSLKVDNVSVSPSTYVYGTPVTDWQSYTPTFTGFGTVTVQNFRWRRVGSNVEIRGRFTSGTPTAVEARISLPSGLTSADSTSIPNINVVGFAGNNGATLTPFNILIEPSVTYFTWGRAGNPSGATKSTGSQLIGLGEELAFICSIPIQGWSSSVQTSDQTDTRVVAAARNTLSSTTITSGTALSFTTTAYDTAGGFTSGTTYTVPVNGFYRVTVSGLAITSPNSTISLAQNGVVGFDFFTANTARSSGSLCVSCRTGDTLTIVPNANSTANTTQCTLFIERLSGPSAIAATESVNAKYFKTATQAFSVETKLTGYTRIFDSHSAWDSSNNRYRFPVSGKYILQIQTHSIPATTSSQVVSYRFNGGATSYYLGLDNGSTFNRFGGVTILTVNAGDYIEIYHYCNASVTVQPNEENTHFSIARVGN